MKKILGSILVLVSMSAFAGPATNDVQKSISSPDVREHFVQLSNQTVSRSEVKQELKQAQQDGSLKQLDSTIYHGGA
jgi:hypothetical protein